MDFFGNTAQVLAIVLLALVWDTRYYDKKNIEARKDRTVWKPPLIRHYSTILAGAVILDIGLCLAILAGAFSKSVVWRGIVGGIVAVTLLSLFVRMRSRIWGKDDLTSEGERKMETDKG